MENSYRIESILFFRLRRIGITKLNSVAVAGCVKSQCTQEIGIFDCWLRIFLLVGERVGFGERRRSGGRHKGSGFAECGSWAGLGTDGSVPFLVVGELFGDETV